MKRTYYTTLALCSAFLLLAGNASALNFDVSNKITIYDGYENASAGTWYGTQEDQEVEYHSVTGQEWDLEGFFLSGSELTMVGGFDFVNGETPWDNYNYRAGDVFIDTDFSNAAYDYVLDLDFINKLYTVYEITQDTVLANPTYKTTSSPWSYVSGGTAIAGFENLSMDYVAGLTDSDVGFQGGSHNAVGLDLSFLPIGTQFLVHNTMECGNDNLMGNGTTAPVPEPATMILFGTGLAGLTGYARKRKK
ncbi:MAG: PEP-CTERM sorting domain-containing protein [Desulfobulbaceae bacterium]|nr:PEP-CTERM sorting domain-containing protein [Desulfobulbaceae bacterium]